MTPEQMAKQVFRDGGLTMAQWAAKNGFKPTSVYAVLAGHRKCVRGESYEIAVALGLRERKEVVFRSANMSG